MGLPSYKINNSYTVYVNYFYLTDCIKAGKKAAAQKKKQKEDFEQFKATCFSNTIKIGSTVKLLDLDTGFQRTLTILSSHNFAPKANTASSSSPIGKALLGHTVGETITVKIPDGIVRYKIQKV